MFKVALLPRNLEACRRDLSSPDAKVRLSVLTDLARGGPEEESRARLELLVTALSDESSDVRRQALIAIADVNGEAALQEVLPLLSDVEIRVRQMAVMCLGEIAGPSDTDVLGRLACLLAAGDPSIRYQALLAHSQLCPEGSAPDLLRALSDQDAEVRELAVRLIDEVMVAGHHTIDGDLKSAVLRACEDVDLGVRLVAQLLAGDLGWEAPRDMIGEVIARRFRVREPRDEQLSLELAGKLGLVDAIPHLSRRAFGRLGFSLDPFRWNALGSLCRLGNSRAFDRLRTALSSRSYMDRTMAAQALGQSHHPQALELLQPLVGKDELLDAEVLERAIEALAAARA